LSKLLINQLKETMRKFYALAVLLLGVGSAVFAGGIVTNMNQSAAWVRMVSRDASTDVDAVFYNPAGLTRLADGFHIQFNNQTIIQKREINNAYTYLNNNLYKGDVFVPTLPTAYVAYKKGNWVLSGGFTVIGGGGGADYKTGLPSFEIPISNLVPGLNPLAPLGQKAGVDMTVTGYSTDINFKGTSAYYGMQINASYKLNDKISVAVGGRYVYIDNSYKGSIKNISVSRAGGSMRADQFLKTVAVPTLTGMKGQVDGIIATSDFLTKIVASQGGSPVSSLPNGQAIIGGLVALGVPVANAGAYTISQAEATFGAAKPTATTQSAQLAGTITSLNNQAAQLGDKEVDVVQNGTGFAPIIGVNLNLLEDKLNIAAKYEFKTSMNAENNTKKDDVSMFPDGAKTGSDIPALLTVGAQYKLLPNFRAQLGFHYYFDRDADYGKKDASGKYPGNEYFIDDNSYETSLGLEFDLNDKLLLSVGYLYASTSPALAYQTDMSYSLKSHTIGFGGNYKITPNFGIDLGIMYTSYQNGEKDITYNPFGTFKETYYKSNVVGSIGLTYNFAKK
jgi:long-chain fatty acid transport protein